MSKTVIETKINMVINSLMVHPDNEPNSEFADMIDNLTEAQDLVKNLTLLRVSQQRELLEDFYYWTQLADYSDQISMQENNRIVDEYLKI